MVSVGIAVAAAKGTGVVNANVDTAMAEAARTLSVPRPGNGTLGEVVNSFSVDAGSWVNTGKIDVRFSTCLNLHSRVVCSVYHPLQKREVRVGGVLSVYLRLFEPATCFAIGIDNTDDDGGCRSMEILKERFNVVFMPVHSGLRCQDKRVVPP